MLKRLDRYILSEFWLPLASGVGIITGVWLGIDKFKEIFKLLAKSGAGFDKGIVIIGLEVPEILAMTLPISVLLATFLTFQKLSGQSEILAMRAAGASFLRILRPAFTLGILAMLATFILSEFVVPLATPLAKKMYVLALYKDPVPQKGARDFSYFEKNHKGTLKRIFYVKSFKKGVLNDVIILDFAKKGLSQIYAANKASWSSDKGGWSLKDGTSHAVKTGKGSGSMDMVGTFKTTFIPSRLNPNQILERITKVGAMNFMDLYKFIALHTDGNLETDELNDSITKFHNKFAYPFSCILLALIGACLGVIGRRKTINWGYILIGLIVFVFYMSQTIFTSFGQSGKMDPFISVWLPNLVIALIALFSIWYRTEKN